MPSPTPPYSMAVFETSFVLFLVGKKNTSFSTRSIIFIFLYFPSIILSDSPRSCYILFCVQHSENIINCESNFLLQDAWFADTGKWKQVGYRRSSRCEFGCAEGGAPSHLQVPINSSVLTTPLTPRMPWAIRKAFLYSTIKDEALSKCFRGVTSVLNSHGLIDDGHQILPSKSWLVECTWVRYLY